MIILLERGRERGFLSFFRFCIFFSILRIVDIISYKGVGGWDFGCFFLNVEVRYRCDVYFLGIFIFLDYCSIDRVGVFMFAFRWVRFNVLVG